MGKDNKKTEEIMCTIGRTAGGTACKAHHRTDRTQYPLQYGQERKDYGTGGVPFLFSERHVSAKTFAESCRGRFRREKA